MAEALRAARLQRVEGNEIYFVTFDLMKKRFDKPQPRAAIDDAFSEVLGQSVAVRFLSESEVPISASSTLADSNAQDADEGADALLKMATEELGGQIVE